MTQFKTVDIVAAAVIAYQQNGNAFFRKDDSKLGIVSNRKIVNSILTGDIAITDSDVLAAERIIADFVQRFTMASLSGKPFNDYISQCVDLWTAGTVHKKYIGTLSWAPKVFDDLCKSDNQKHEFTVLSYGSKYLGAVGKTVEIDFTAISKRYNRPFQAWRYIGHDNNGNLVTFLSSTEFSNTSVCISGRIKTTELSNYTNGKTTILSNVKEIKSI